MKSYYILKTQINSVNSQNLHNPISFEADISINKTLSNIISAYPMTMISAGIIALILIIAMLIISFLTKDSTISTKVTKLKSFMIMAVILLILFLAYMPKLFNINHNMNEMMNDIYQYTSLAIMILGSLSTILFIVWVLSEITYKKVDNPESLLKKVKLGFFTKTWIIGDKLISFNIFSVVVSLFAIALIGKTTLDVMCFLKNMESNNITQETIIENQEVVTNNEVNESEDI